MQPTQKRRLTYVGTAITVAVIIILAVILLQQPIQNKTTPPPTTAATSVATIAATGVNETVATLNGNLGGLGSASSALVGFYYGTDAALSGATNATIARQTASASFNQALTGLTPGTAYYFQAWASGNGFANGSVLSFTTLPPSAPQKNAPSVSTSAATGITTQDAVLNGNLGSLGTASSVTVGFLVGKSPSLVGATNLSAGTKTATGAFNDAFVGLDANTTYYVQAWGLGDGYANGSILSFTTAKTPPGNGNIVPPGWAHAACPNVPEQAKAHGVRARCEHNMTYGEMKKQGLVVIVPGLLVDLSGYLAALRAPERGNPAGGLVSRRRLR